MGRKGFVSGPLHLGFFGLLGKKERPKRGGMGQYRLLEHTADMGIEAVAETREELFAQAAYGFWR